jgi:predicted amidophosphoribosyltransferase
LPVWAAAWYRDEVRRVIVAWKRQGRGELEREMKRALARTAEAAAKVLAPVSLSVAVVPIPSRLIRVMARTGGGTRVLAMAVTEALAGSGLAASYADVLTRRASSREQAGRGARDRAAGREGTTGLRRVPAEPCLLVDDVLTTGATLLDAERTLARRGGKTLGAVVLAASPAGSADTDARPHNGAGE